MRLITPFEMSLIAAEVQSSEIFVPAAKVRMEIGSETWNGESNRP